MDKQIAFVIPTTSNKRKWTDIKDSYLYQSLSKLKYEKINIYIGIDDDDIFFVSKFKALPQFLPHLNLTFIINNNEKGNVVSIWNHLTRVAIQDGNEYIFCIGDDIIYPDDKLWLPLMITKLELNNNIGFSAGDSGNPQLPMTQFMIHKTHFETFGYVFNPLLKNWYCDNYLNELYPKKYINYFEYIKLGNNGGEPRYTPLNDAKLYKMCVRRDKKKLNKLIN